MKSLKATILECELPNDINKLAPVWDKCVEYMGETEMLNAIFLAMSSQEVKEMLEYIDRMHDLGLVDEYCEEEYD